MRTIESILADIDRLKVELDILRQSLDNATIKEALEVELVVFQICWKA
jgi:hypothetical protein